MPELIEDLHVSTQGDGPTIDAALGLAKTALQAADLVALDGRVTFLEDNPGLPPMPNLGDILMAAEDGVVDAVSLYPILLNQLAAGLANLSAIVESTNV